jgi:autotransporter adhesin
LNKFYKSVWNASSGTYVAVAETIRGCGKKSSRKVRSIAMLAAAAASGWPLQTAALSALVTATAVFSTEAFAEPDGPDGATSTVQHDCASASGCVVAPQTSHSALASGLNASGDGSGDGTSGGASGNYFKVNSIAANAAATGIDAIAVGPSAWASETDSAALGVGAQARGVNAVAIGYMALATDDGALAVGTRAGAGSPGSTAVGTDAAALSANTTVIGSGASTGYNSSNGVAIGYHADAGSPNTLALGTNSAAAGDSSIALGYSAFTAAGALGAMALGSGASASAAGAVALGADSVADRANAVSVGAVGSARQIINVAAGSQDTDAVNMAQLKAMGANVDSSGGVTNAFVAYDDKTRVAVTLGGAGATTPVLLTNLARGQIATGSRDAVNGSQLYAHAASTAVALGGGSTVNADGTITAPSYSVGGTVVNSVGGAISNLDGRVTQNTSDIASLQTTVGSISGTVANAVQYDSSAHNAVTLGGSASASPVKLTNLQAGTLSATSTDAVTGAQLWSTNQQVSELTQAVQNVQTYGTTGISTNTDGTPAAATGTNSTAIGGGATASGANSVAIGQGSVADQANTVSVGSAGNERRITNVADGIAPTDAVNMRQFESGMNEIARNAYSGTASAIALTMIPDVDANKNLAIGVGTSGYKGYQAVAVGLSARVTQSLKVKLGAGISSAATTVGAGAAYQW